MDDDWRRFVVRDDAGVGVCLGVVSRWVNWMSVCGCVGGLVRRSCSALIFSGIILGRCHNWRRLYFHRFIFLSESVPWPWSSRCFFTYYFSLEIAYFISKSNPIIIIVKDLMESPDERSSKGKLIDIGCRLDLELAILVGFVFDGSSEEDLRYSELGAVKVKSNVPQVVVRTRLRANYIIILDSEVWVLHFQGYAEVLKFIDW